MSQPTIDDDSDDDMSGFYRDLRIIRQAESEGRRRTATEQFPAARQLAANHGMALVRHDDANYQLRHPAGWILSIYPGKRRLYHDANRPGPYIRAGSDWTLVSVVEAAATAMR